MLGKLLKHEFTATGRIMLPIYGAVVILTVLVNLSVRFMDSTSITALRILFGLIIFAFFMGIVAAAVITAVIMILRFYRSLLKEQGYLMHTLPVTVHGHIWSKLIVSLVWFAATFLIVLLAIALTALIQSGTDLGAMMAELPTWSEFRQMLAEAGISGGDLTLAGLEALAYAILTCLVTCLHFYAAMTLGHMFSRSKVLLSVVFFVVISILFSILETGMAANVVRSVAHAEHASGLIVEIHRGGGVMLLVQLVKAGLLYAATALGLQKGLNL